MISINATLFVQIVHFLVLAFILNRLMFRPLLKLIGERNHYVEKTKGEIKEFGSEMERIREEILDKERKARREAAKERFQIRNAGIAQADEYLQTSQEQVVSIRSEAEQRARSELKKTKPRIQKEAAALVNDILEKVVGRKVED
jgi:F-type H+-transporting ATPase subunit b